MIRKIAIFLICVDICLASDILNVCDIEFSNGYKIENVLAANTQESRAKGLSQREDIGTGMIFIWNKPNVVLFWMKDTLVPLSVGFFDKNMRLFQVENMKPLSLDTHISSKEVAVALELKQGDFEKHNISINTKIVKMKCE